MCTEAGECCDRGDADAGRRRFQRKVPLRAQPVGQGQLQKEFRFPLRHVHFFILSLAKAKGSNAFMPCLFHSFTYTIRPGHECMRVCNDWHVLTRPASPVACIGKLVLLCLLELYQYV